MIIKIKRESRSGYNISIHLTLLLCLIGQVIQVTPAIAQLDQSHYSSVFGGEKSYRVFLPKNYHSSENRYPVIYYFHGNKGTHKLDIPGVADLVEKNDVILVAWNGRSIDEDIRPYNIGNHSNVNYQVQFKDYFLELVDHIDSRFRTLTDRSNRAVIGHSMGGIMSFFLAAKYPDRIGTAVNSKGSPEFFIGYPDNHTLYSVRYFFKYLHGVNIRFHNSSDGELVYLNNEVHQGAIREKGLSYEYQVYEGGHKLMPKGFEDAFNFVIQSFKDPAPDPQRWHHADIYPEFNIWGYEIESNLDGPGFIDLKGVTKGGMGISTKKWQPLGRPIPGVKINVKTPAIYEPNKVYNFLDYNVSKDTKSLSKLESDSLGRITFATNHENHQIGIYRKNDPGEIVFLSYKVNEKDAFLEQNEDSNLRLQILNRGGKTIKNLRVHLSTEQPDVEIDKTELIVKEIRSGESIWLREAFIVRASNEPVKDGAPFRIRFNLNFSNNNNTWQDEFDAPVFYDVLRFTNIGIDDGDTEIFGSGNGNNVAEPGETVMFYEITGMSKRLRVYYDDPYLDERLYDEIQPDKWGDGYTLSSLIRVSEDCPIGHKIRFLASYEVKEWKAIKRNVTWGTFTITVGGDKEQ